MYALGTTSQLLHIKLHIADNAYLSLPCLIGTWVPMERGVALSRQYGVDRLLQPIFDYLPTADSPPLAPKHITALPARPKKKLLADHDGNGSPAPPTKAQTSRVTASKAAAAKKAAENRKAAEERKREESEEEAAMRELGSERSASRTPSEASEASETPSLADSEMGGDGEYQESGSGAANNGSRKRKHQESMGHGSGNGSQQMHPHQQQQQQQQQSQQSQHQQQQQPSASNTAYAQLSYGGGSLRYARMILDYFVSESTQVPDFLLNPPEDFDANVVIDDDGHTALHWACAMGRMRIVKLLLSAGADIFRANSMGQTPLMRSVMFTNNYDLRKFPELFELLHRSTINIDRNDRTVFHYVVDIALQKGKTHAARYYIETILARLSNYPKEVADILNFQDEEGETALSLAARARSKRLVKILLDNGGDPKVVNRDGKTAEDYILEDERFRESDLLLTGAGQVTGEGQGVHQSGPAGTGIHHLPIHPSTSSLLPSFVPQLHSSEVGQRTSSRCIPQIASLLESLATSFDKELADTDRDLQQALTLLANINAEILESKRTVAALNQRAAPLPSLAAKESELVEELENKMGKRFRLGWEKWVRDEDGRESEYVAALEAGTTGRQVEADLEALLELSRNPPADSVERCQASRKVVEELKEERKGLFTILAKLESGVGTGERTGMYRQLIALGCGVSINKVDEVIDSLCENVEGREDGFVL